MKGPTPDSPRWTTPTTCPALRIISPAARRVNVSNRIVLGSAP